MRKSTLVKLLMRLYDVQDGSILYEGKDIKQYDLNTYRRMFATVFQDCRLFSISVAENVLLGRSIDNKMESQELVHKALEKSKMHETIMSYPKGIDTILTKEFDEDGVVLSGGQAQKIALTRVYANHNRRIVILDEPSSALDPIAEAEMYQMMLEICKNNSVIFISHRMSSATLADIIYYMEDGNILESGSHEELMHLNGKYCKMFEIQSKNYQEQLL